MPVRCRSRCSTCANTCLLLRLRCGVRQARDPRPQRSRHHRRKLKAVRERLWYRCAAAARSIHRGLGEESSVAPHPGGHSGLDCGNLPQRCRRASTSRGFAVSSVTRLSSRSRSSTPSRARRSSSVRWCPSLPLPPHPAAPGSRLDRAMAGATMTAAIAYPWANGAVHRAEQRDSCVRSREQRFNQFQISDSHASSTR